LASFDSYLDRAIQLRRTRFNLLLEPNLVRLQISELGGEGLQRGNDASQVLKKEGYLPEIVKQSTLQEICIAVRKKLTEGGVAVAAVGETSFPLEREEAVDA
jgi:hypothetical protein